MVLLKSTARKTPLEAPLRTIYAALRSTYRRIRSRSVKTAATHSHLFARDDVVVVVDGNWQFAGYVEAMATTKTKIGFRFIHFVHDIIAVKNPALASPGADRIIGSYFRKVFKFADSLLAISESTKRDLNWFMDSMDLAERPPVYVVQLGDTIATESSIKPKAPASLKNESFILAVSTIEIRKNYILLYYAYKLALQKGIKLPHLVIVGRKGWLADEAFLLLTRDSEVNDSITILQKADDQELEWLYQHCLFTVFPSFYEGWGLPIAESLNHGKSCISSNTSSMPEVGGDLVKYVSPYDPAELVEAIVFMMDEANRSKYETTIREHYKAWPWHESYEALSRAIADRQ